MEYDFLDFSSDALGLVTDNYFRIEALRGYCENLDDENVSSAMMTVLLEDISKKQYELIKYIDNNSTKLAHSMLKS